MSVKRSYRFRFYPSQAQAETLANTFGCARYAYNYMLRLRTDAWLNERKRVDYHETSAKLTMLKKDPQHLWLAAVSSVPMQQALRHLNTAFVNFFAKRAKYPAYRRRDDVQAAEYTSVGFRWHGDALLLAKMDQPLSVRWSRAIPDRSKITTVTVTMDKAKRYFVSLLCDERVQEKPKVPGVVGIDLGLTHFATLSTGEKVNAPRLLRSQHSSLRRLHRRLVAKTKGSRNREKARIKLARLHARITDARKDFLHKLSTRLINENQVIAVENLAVANMQRNRHLAKSIGDAGWSEFLRQLAYKGQWYGRTVVAIDRWFPSSKRCSDCGASALKMPLSVRQWTCPECGASHDRDVNAARNILAAGLAVSACGDTVRPTHA